MKKLMRLTLPSALLCLSAASIAADAPAKPATPALTLAQIIERSQPSDWRPLDAQNTLYMELPAGRVIIELAPAFGPRHVQNIKALAREGYFDGLTILRSQDNYVVQWGDPEEVDQSKIRPMRTIEPKIPAEFTVPAEGIAFTPLPDKDGYAPQTGFSNGFPAGRDPKKNQAWLCHCYGAVGVGRGNEADSGVGNSLYAVIGHAPRHLDRNISVVGRVVQGMELLSTMPRGPAPMGFYDKPEMRVPIKSVKVAADVAKEDRTELEILRTDTQTFAQLVESRRNRRGEWDKYQAGYIEVCNVPLIVRKRAGSADKN